MASISQFFSWLSDLAIVGNNTSRLRGTRTIEEKTATPRKWLPVIAQDDCTGCAQCVKACEQGCLELVWDFATLQRPDQCSSEGNCVAACPDNLIRMEWVRATGDPQVGRWRQPSPKQWECEMTESG